MSGKTVARVSCSSETGYVTLWSAMTVRDIILSDISLCLLEA
jgi:hypothetical protein